MTDALNLEDVDVDGAIRETAHEAFESDGDTRLGFLRKAGVAGGAALSGGAVLGALAPDALAAGHGRPPAKFGKGDIGILNYALTLEYLEAAFYNEATAKGAIKDPQTRAFLKTVTDDENAHVRDLKAALGRKAVKKPKFDFKGTTADQSKFQHTAFTLENTGVHAYLGQGLNLKSAKIIKTALGIATVEARHAGVIGLIVVGSESGIAANGPIDNGLPASKILAAVKSTGFIVG